MPCLMAMVLCLRCSNAAISASISERTWAMARCSFLGTRTGTSNGTEIDADQLIDIVNAVPTAPIVLPAYTSIGYEFAKTEKCPFKWEHLKCHLLKDNI